MSRSPRHTHDQTFHALMSHRSFATGFYRTYLPSSVAKRVDFETLEIFNVSGRVVDDKGGKVSQTDIVHTVKLDDIDLMLWTHVEHQTTAERFMPIRIGHYQCGKLLEYAKLNKCNALPPIISFIYYQGTRPYRYSVDVLDCFADRELANQYFIKPILVDLPALPDFVIEEHEIGPAELILKYIRSQLLGENYNGFIRALRVMDDKVRYLLIDYLVTSSELGYDELVESVLEHLPEDKEKIVTPAEQLLQRGRQQGMQQGVQQGVQEGIQKIQMLVVQKMLEAGEPVERIMNYTDVDIEMVLKLEQAMQAT